MGILLTQYNGKILGPIAKVLGIILNAIFNVLDRLGMPNIGLSIIILTIVIYMFLTPLTFKQQKFAKMSAIMQPEIKAIQDKYKGKNDTDSMQRQNEELQTVYKKYGVSPAGSCVQLLIQMPILFALYRVIYNIPAYIENVKNTLMPLAEGIVAANGGSDFMKSLEKMATYFPESKYDYTQTSTIIDVLNRCSMDQWNQIADQFPQLSDIYEKAHSQFISFYTFGWINIASTPGDTLAKGWGDKDIILIIGALLIPLLAAGSQWLNILFMPQQNNNDSDNPMAQSMKSMNVMMPVMSAVFCFSLPAGLGIYWIASACVRCVQQVAINKYFDKVGLEKIIEKNMEKAKKNAKKDESKERVSKSMMKYANNLKTKNIESIDNSGKEIKKGSMAEKAAMVRRLNNKEN